MTEQQDQNQLNQPADQSQNQLNQLENQQTNLPAKRNSLEDFLKRLEKAAYNGLDMAQAAADMGIDYDKMMQLLIMHGDLIRQAFDKGYLRKQKVFLEIMEEKALAGGKDSTAATAFMIRHYQGLHRQVGASLMVSNPAVTTTPAIKIQTLVEEGTIHSVVKDYEDRLAE